MTKTLIVLSGLPGSGKTHTRLTDPDLRDLPAFDIADIYQEALDKYQLELDWYMATSELLRAAVQALTEHDVVIIEGCFMPDSPSMEQVRQSARVYGFTVDYRTHDVDPVLCAERIGAQYAAGEIDWPKANRRIKLLKRMIKA